MIRLAIALLALAALAVLPRFVSEYELGLLIGMASYVALASAWALFSGHTHYISLATVAFFGTGAYTVAVLDEVRPIGSQSLDRPGRWRSRCRGGWSTLIGARASISLIFTFGLAELVRQLITWYEVSITGTLGRYIFLDLTARDIYWQMLALAAMERADRLDQPHQAGTGAQGHRRRRGGGGAFGHPPGADQAGRLHHLGHADHACRRGRLAPLGLCRAADRVQSDRELPDRHHGASGRRQPVVGTAGRRHSAFPSVRMAIGEFSRHLSDLPRADVHRGGVQLGTVCSPARPDLRASAWKAQQMALHITPAAQELSPPAGDPRCHQVASNRRAARSWRCSARTDRARPRRSGRSWGYRIRGPAGSALMGRTSPICPRTE